MNILLFSVKELLNADRWKSVIKNDFRSNEIAHLPRYKNWTEETILHQKSASFKGVKTDICFQQILVQSKAHEPCYISSFCQEMMLDKTRLDTGYLLTHR